MSKNESKNESRQVNREDIKRTYAEIIKYLDMDKEEAKELWMNTVPPPFKVKGTGVDKTNQEIANSFSWVWNNYVK